MIFTKAILAAAALAVSCAATAADWPTKPVKIVLPTAAGSPPDVVARLVADRLGQLWKQQVLIDNKPGASGVIGMAGFKQAPADQHNFVLAQAAVITVTPHVLANPRFSVDADLTPVAPFAFGPMMFAVRTDSAASNMQDLIKKARANPLSVTIGVNGQYSIPHLTAEAIKRAADLKVNIVSFGSSGSAITALMNGDIQVLVDGIPPIDPMLKAQRVKALAVSSAKRMPGEPNVPTLAEALPGSSEFTGWFVLFAKKGIPAVVIEKINRDVAKVLEDPALIERFADLGVYPRPLSPQETEKFVDAERVRWGAVLKELNIKPQ